MTMNGETERLVIIGDSAAAERFERLGAEAGWDVRRSHLYRSDCGPDAGALSDGDDDAIEAATIVVVATPAAAHPALSILLAGRVAEEALLLLASGQVGGALQFAKSLRRGGAGPTVAELSWLPPAGIADVWEYPLPIAAVPFEAAQAVADRLSSFLPLTPVSSPLWTALHSPDLPLVAVPSILGAASADRNLANLLSGAAIPVVECLEDERAAIAVAIGIEVPSTARWLAELQGVRLAPLDMVLGPLGTLSLAAFDDLNALADVVPYGLVPLRAIAAAVGVETPCIDALITLASAMLRNDYALGGRGGAVMDLDAILAQHGSSTATAKR
ncbi:MAG: NAD/NADP octopine/nopaline dehydrogenase family protein [Sphingopyxis granuli]